LRGQLNIFKQDSTFQNTKTALALSYYLDYDTRIYLGYQSTLSSDIQNSNNSLITDYKSSYLTSELAYSKIYNRNSMFLHRSRLNIKTGIGTRETNKLLDNSAINKQFYFDLLAMHTFYLNEKNSINIKSKNYFLQSTNYITNELFRFGGVNSIRGFTENSLQANLMTALLTEYRYAASPTLYFYTIIDYSILQDSSLQTETSLKSTLLRLRIGLGIKTKSGILKISIAAGSPSDQKIEFSNPILHLNYNLKF
jgi:hemolysin activation/secretion protein